MPSARIDRIVGADFLLRSRAPMLVLNQGCLGNSPQNRFFNGIGQNNDQSEQMFAVRLPRKKPRESGASSRFGVCQDSLGPGEIGELSSPPLTLAVFRLAEIHSKEPGLHRSVRRSP